jgi:hypothetical protein
MAASPVVKASFETPAAPAPYTKVGIEFYLRLDIEKTLSSAVVGHAGGQLRMRSNISYPASFI